MATLLARLADAASRRRRLVIGAWLALLLGASWFSLHQSDRLSGGGWDVPGSSSVRVSDELDTFPSFSSPALSILVTGRSPAAVRTRLAAARATAARDRTLRPNRARLFDGGRAALLPVTYIGPSGDAIDVATRVRHALVQTTPETQTRVIGQPAIWSNFTEVAKRQLARGELTGFPLILVILLGAFGTLVAALAPLALGFAAVFLTGAAIYGLSHAFEMSIYVTNMASMIGIGVAVDYSLFVVSRFRRELRGGATRDEALRRALSSSGTAVVFSGAAVAVSLGGLFVIDVNAVRSMAIGAIVVVTISVLATVTLLPALLSLVGPGVERLRVRLPWRTGESGDPVFWRRWTEAVMAHPLRALALTVPLLLLVAAPLLDIRTNNRGLEQLPRGAEVRQATEAAERLAGPGFAGPIHVIVGDRRAAESIRAGAARIPGVASRVAPSRSRRRRFPPPSSATAAGVATGRPALPPPRAGRGAA